MPSSLISTSTGSRSRRSVMTQRRAPECRTTFVIPSRTTQLSSMSVSRVSAGPDSFTTQSTPAVARAARALSSSKARLASR
ncbi:hypothetical protein B1L11_21220 [Microbispora sp. GKU 823]|nr:hypothetical protein B1L11_21220 [Microbispora sp. GKU 823]